MPMVNGRYHMNPMFGAAIERERQKSEGGKGESRATHIEVHPSEDGHGFKVRVHRGPDISGEKPETHEFPSHEEMIQFVTKFAHEAHGPRGEKAERPEPQGDEDDSGNETGIRVPGAKIS